MNSLNLQVASARFIYPRSLRSSISGLVPVQQIRSPLLHLDLDDLKDLDDVLGTGADEEEIFEDLDPRLALELISTLKEANEVQNLANLK